MLGEETDFRAGERTCKPRLEHLGKPGRDAVLEGSGGRLERAQTLT